MARRKTIYDIAELANASPSAVSSVLNGSWRKRRISPKTAERVLSLADEHGYSRNIQASLLRRAKSNIIGMIIPKYDNRYFGAIAEQFETMARARGLFPVITCAQRDPDIEAAAARELVSYRVDTIIATGATAPDRITEICAAAGVGNLNLDLPGQIATSVVSDNRGGAKAVTGLLLDACREAQSAAPAIFVGGRPGDHNTAERIAGFRDAHEERGLSLPETNILACGYAAGKAFAALNGMLGPSPAGIFVNSTISLEGVVRWLDENDSLADGSIRFACFDWDPFAALIPGNVAMARQDVEAMVAELFTQIESGNDSRVTIRVPCRIEQAPSALRASCADPSAEIA